MRFWTRALQGALTELWNAHPGQLTSRSGSRIDAAGVDQLERNRCLSLNHQLWRSGRELADGKRVEVNVSAPLEGWPLAGSVCRLDRNYASWLRRLIGMGIDGVKWLTDADCDRRSIVQERGSIRV